ncbi:MAG: manganese efflux pump MntP family protein [Lachnospiraceae bacterium]|jgi:putative Mn2+ efflux pump MntP
MSLLELVILSIGLAMDAFAVSICKGLAMKSINMRKASVCGVWFGTFQAVMPIIGYFAGVRFASYIVEFDHWIAFVLLLAIGGNMIREALFSDENEADDSLGFKTMLMMAIATSIDALAVGITFVCVPVNIISGISVYINTLIAAAIIGIITFIISSAGVWAGSIFGLKYKSKAEIAGGLVLIILGFKILIEHLVYKM